MKRLMVLGALLLVLGTNARADNFSVNSLFGSIGENLDNGQSANGVGLTDTTPSSPLYNAPFTAFSVDLTNQVGSGINSFTGTITLGASPNQPLSAPYSTIWGSTPYLTDVGARLDYLVTQIWFPTAGVPLTNDQAAALQAVIWNVTGNYGYNPGGSSTLDQDVAALMTLVGAPGSNGSTVSGTPWSALNNIPAYNMGSNYGGSLELFLLVPDSNGNGGLQYPVMIGGGDLAHTQVATSPEPSTLLLAGFSALGMIGYGWKQRKRS